MRNENINKAKIKKIMMFTPLLILFLILAVITINDMSKKKKSEEVFAFRKEGDLTFYSINGEKIKTIDIEIADTDYDRQLGLMFRNKLEENEGMLFIFPYESKQSFWMKNTKISLDIIYVNSKKEIVSIQKNTIPYSEISLPSFAPAQYVVEVNSSWTSKNKVKEGDKIDW